VREDEKGPGGTTTNGLGRRVYHRLGPGRTSEGQAQKKRGARAHASWRDAPAWCECGPWAARMSGWAVDTCVL